MTRIPIPYNYTPRDYQIPFWEAMDNGFNRAILVWPRRSGKEKTCLNFTVKKTFERTGTYLYLFPQYKQARKVLWDGMDKEGFKFLDHIPKEYRDGEPNQTEMKIKTKKGSIIQMAGSDNIDSWMSSNPIGVVLAEYSLHDPKAWSFLRPILAENGGWAVFDYTPRGENHAYDLFNLAKADPEKWFLSHLTCNDTKHIPEEVLKQEEKEIIRLHGNNAHFRQEYYCDFSVPIAGAYYAEQMIRASDEHRITKVPYEPRLPVYTAWDLGFGDKNAIWYFQKAGNELRLIECEADSGKSMIEWIKRVKEKPYVYADHYGPHDIKVHEYSSGKTRWDIAKEHGITFKVIPKLSVSDGIDSVRLVLGKCWFDEEKCKDGISALKSYHKDYDEEKKCYSDTPCHDWSSNASDSFRYLALSIDHRKIDAGHLSSLMRQRRDAMSGWQDGCYIPKKPLVAA